MEREHKIEQAVKVYLEWDVEAGRWAIDPATVDGYELDSPYENAPSCDYQHEGAAQYSPFGGFQIAEATSAEAEECERLLVEAGRARLPDGVGLYRLLGASLAEVRPDSSLPEDPAVTALRSVGALVDEYDGWRERRADLSAAEPNVDPDEWHVSDDTGCDLARRAVELLRVLVGHPV